MVYLTDTRLLGWGKLPTMVLWTLLQAKDSWELAAASSTRQQLALRRLLGLYQTPDLNHYINMFHLIM